MLGKLATIRKAVAAGVGTLLLVLTFVADNLLHWLPNSAATVLVFIISVLTPIATYLVPNQPRQVVEYES